MLYLCYASGLLSRRSFGLPLKRTYGVDGELAGRHRSFPFIAKIVVIDSVVGVSRTGRPACRLAPGAVAWLSAAVASFCMFDIEFPLPKKKRPRYPLG